MCMVLKLLDLALYLHSGGFSMEYIALDSAVDSALKVIHDIMIYCKIVAIAYQSEKAAN